MINFLLDNSTLGFLDCIRIQLHPIMFTRSPSARSLFFIIHTVATESIRDSRSDILPGRGVEIYGYRVSLSKMDKFASANFPPDEAEVNTFSQPQENRNTYRSLRQTGAAGQVCI